jgi:glucosamine 6-phosphate synthetase-like amidotransferase/phosphosugar isomerase protein
LADNEVLVELGSLAASRGPHSHGYARLTEHDERTLVVKRAEGSFEHSLRDLDLMQTRGIIGHSRLATTGTYAGGAPDLDDTMPFIVGGVSIVHNGNIRAHRRVANYFDFDLNSDCDSEVIAHLLDRFLRILSRQGAYDLPLALARTVATIDDGRPFVVIALDIYGNLAAMRRELPLFAWGRWEGMYLCSRQPKREGENIEPVSEMHVWGFPRSLVRA